MDTAVGEVLKTLGWDSGFYLPIASDQNKILEKELAVLILRKSKASKDFNDASQKRGRLESHLNHVKQQSQQNLKIISMYDEQTNAQKNKFKLTLAEKDGLSNEIKRMRKVFDETNERVNFQKNELQRCTEKMEKIKAEAAWDAEAIKAWEESLKNRDEDNEILKKFALKDQKKGIELEAKRQHLKVEMVKKKEAVAKIVDDIINYEQMLEKTSKILKQSIEERSSLIKQWQEAVRNLRQRDQDSKRVYNDIENLSEAINQNEIILNDENAFLVREQKENEFIEIENSDCNKLNSKIRNELIQVKDINAFWSIEVHSKIKTVEVAIRNLKNLQILNKDTTLTISKKEAVNQCLKDEIAQLLSKLENLEGKHSTSIERSKELEGMLNNINKIEHDSIMELEILNNRYYHYQTKVNQVTDKLNVMKGEVLASENFLAATKNEIIKEKKLLARQEKHVRGLEIKIAYVEAILAVVEGRCHSDEDKLMWSTQIKDLEIANAEHDKIKSLLWNQVLHLQKEGLRLNNAIADNLRHLTGYKNEVQSLMLMTEGGVKQISATKLQNQHKQVLENVLKLKVDKFGKAMNREEKEIYNLRLYRVELLATMKERQVENQIAKEVLLAKKKNLEEERGRLKSDVSLRNIKIKHLQSKFCIVSTALGQDDLGQPLSMATFKIKYAQEKYLMQQEGDEMDQKVRKAEAEIIAMENTLKIVNQTNCNFKHNLLPVEVEEEAILNNLIEAAKESNAILREKKNCLLAKHTLFKEMEENFKELNIKRDDVREEYRRKNEELYQLEQGEIDKKEKIARADRQINKSRKNITPKNLNKYDKILKVRQFQETNKESLRRMANFSSENIETTPVINKYFKDYQLVLPRVRTSLSINSSESIRTPSTSSSSLSSPSTLCNVAKIQLGFSDV